MQLFKNKHRQSYAAPWLSLGPVLACLLLLVLASGCAPGRIVRASDGAAVELAQLTETMRGTEAVFVGEEHGKRRHHAMELRIIRALDEAGVKIAVGMEVFMATDQESLDRWVMGEMTEMDFKKVYYKHWKLPWRKYKKILLYARDNGVPVVGLNVSKKLVHKVFTGGIEALSPDELAGMPGIRCEVHPAYEKMIKDAVGEHTMEGVGFINYCEAQMVWDSSMATKILAYLTEHPGTTMVVIAGGGHSWKHGIPEQIRRRARIKSLVIMPEMSWSDGSKTDMITAEEADYIWFAR